MSKLVIIGGHDCMACKYKELCEQYNCKAKVFTQVLKIWNRKLETLIWWCCLLIPFLIEW